MKRNKPCIPGKIVLSGRTQTIPPKCKAVSKTLLRSNWFTRIKNGKNRLSVSKKHKAISGAVDSLEEESTEIGRISLYISHLPEKQNTILIRFLSGFGPEEIALETGIPRNEISHIIRKSRKTIRTLK